MKMDFTVDIPNGAPADAPDRMEQIRSLNAKIRVAARETGLTVLTSRLSTDEYHEKLVAAADEVGRTT